MSVASTNNGRYGVCSGSRYQPGASTWNTAAVRAAAARGPAGSAARSFSRAADTSAANPRSAAAPGSPANSSDRASPSLIPVSRVR
ncbi:hypothetical protein SIN09_32420 [Streptomyces sp. F8]|nr:hypothetical protein [Streptomyces sp. F8]MDX6763978.1 hypothetical protein [Streptomyces sp. F8]